MPRTPLILAMAVALPAPLAAQEASPAPAIIEAARLAEDTGAQMAQVQAAVALAQRQYAAMVAQEPGASYQGAVALPGDSADSWLAIIVGRRGEGVDAPLVALAEYEIADGAILSEVIHLPGDAPALDGAASAMAQARAFAPRAVLSAGFTSFCMPEPAPGAPPQSGVTFATIVLPPREDGRFDAWVLNGPIEEGQMPLGKHFRVAFDEFGLEGEPSPVSDSCEVVNWDTAAPAQAAARSYTIDYSGHDAPDAIHAFVSRQVPMGLTVVTGDWAWPIANGVIGDPLPVARD